MNAQSVYLFFLLPFYVSHFQLAHGSLTPSTSWRHRSPYCASDLAHMGWGQGAVEPKNSLSVGISLDFGPRPISIADEVVSFANENVYKSLP